MVLVRVTEAAGTSAALDLLLDIQLDGTNWATWAPETDNRQWAVWGGGGADAERECTDRWGPVADANAGTLRNVPFGDAMRLRRQITGPGPSSAARCISLSTSSLT